MMVNIRDSQAHYIRRHFHPVYIIQTYHNVMPLNFYFFARQLLAFQFETEIRKK